MINKYDYFTRYSAYVPAILRDERPFERLAQIAKKQDRSLNHVILEAICEYVDRHEHKHK